MSWIELVVLVVLLRLLVHTTYVFQLPVYICTCFAKSQDVLLDCCSISSHGERESKRGQLSAPPIQSSMFPAYRSHSPVPPWGRGWGEAGCCHSDTCYSQEACCHGGVGVPPAGGPQEGLILHHSPSLLTRLLCTAPSQPWGTVMLIPRYDS